MNETACAIQPVREPCLRRAFEARNRQERRARGAFAKAVRPVHNTRPRQNGPTAGRSARFGQPDSTYSTQEQT